MIISDRLRQLQEEKKLLGATSKRERVCCAATFPASKTDIPSQQSRR